ncbi:MAG TPA: rhodanese-like domain-containing protein [Methylomirabilota bacterium]|nr:rhodanese-like domain-containing protein [Methylomirabilota bacterium]
MIFQQVVNEEAGCLSYLIGCGQAGQAAIVDPARDRIAEYVTLARRKGLTITHIIETHVHADHVSGNQALAAKTGARIHLHPAADAAFAHAPVEDGDEIKIGNVALRVVHTPGHTPDSIALLVTDLSRGQEPWFVLTGDTLFIGDVGRPDFGGEMAAAHLYRSLTERLLVLPDSVEVYPAHGAGSTCGRAMSSKTASTIGFERRFNPALQARGVDDFVRRLMTGLPPKPPNFERIIARNRAQSPPPLTEAPPLGAAQVEAVLAKSGVVLDVRTPEEFGEGHIPGAVNVWIESPQFSTRAGWFLPADAPVVLVAGGPTDLGRAVQGLSRIGLDTVAGYLQWGMGDWRSQGRPVASVPQITVHDLATMREEQPDLVVVDVREPFEWEEGHIAGAVHLPMAEAVKRMGDLPANRPKAALCAGGLRSSTVISALAREGLTHWVNVSGGMTAWVRAGYPVTPGGP